MSVEIERKFLIHKLPQDVHKRTSKKIIQGYMAISGDGTEIRLRKKENVHYQTAKCGKGLKRHEIEAELTKAQFDIFWPLTEGKRVEKIRYEIPYGDWIIQLDIYEGSLEGLMTAEVEFQSQEDAEAFTPPEWMGREVTQDDRYKNKNLALHGLPPEKLSTGGKP